MSHYGYNMLKYGTECGNNWMKNPIYSKPAVKRLRVKRVKSNESIICSEANVLF